MTDDVVAPTLIDGREDDGRRTLARLRETDVRDAEEWATARTKLGFACAQRSEGDRSENWELAIAAFTEALSARSRAANPEEWAAASANLGVAYRERVAGARDIQLERAQDLLKGINLFAQRAPLPDHRVAKGEKVAAAK